MRESMREIKLMKGNEALAYAAVSCGCDAYFGYPITPQSEIMETLMELQPWRSTGMVVLQSESEVASINMVYGAAAAGKRALTSSSGPGISLMCEGISYLAGAELPCVIVNCQRGGPGLGTIQPSQADYFQACKGGGHGDYRLIVLAPNSVQEMHDHVALAFDLAFKYRNPALILSDGVIGQMMERVVLSTKHKERSNVLKWSACGNSERKANGGESNVITSLALQAPDMEMLNRRLQWKYIAMEDDVMVEETLCDDAEYIIVAFGSSARICSESVAIARERGLKVGLIRPITLFPFPSKAIERHAIKGAKSGNLKGLLSAELNAGQMVEDVRLAVGGRIAVEHYGRQGGVIFTPEEVIDELLHIF